jgi:hypothetical protein
MREELFVQLADSGAMLQSHRGNQSIDAATD